jgi:hypothetical protein
MPELTEGRGEAEKPEGVAVQRLPFKGTRYQCARKPLPHTRGLGQVEIAATPWLYAKPLQFVLVGLPELIPREAARVMDAAEDHQRAHLEAPGEAIEPATKVPARLIFGPQDRERHQQLGRNLAAPPFNIMRRRGDRPEVRECRVAQPEVSQFVRKREHLRGLAVRTIDEHQRGKIIGERKATKLVCVEPFGPCPGPEPRLLVATGPSPMCRRHAEASLRGSVGCGEREDAARDFADQAAVLIAMHLRGEFRSRWRTSSTRPARCGSIRGPSEDRVGASHAIDCT